MNTSTRIKREIAIPLLQWYDRNARILPWREDPQPYAVWISEIMLQQTRVDAVIPYYHRWLKAFPDLKTLAEASEDEVLKLWEGLGYYSRVRNVHKASKIIMEKYGGSLPASFAELRNLPGIGEYTAGSVGSIAFQLPVPCVDGNVLRVVTRLTADQADIGSVSTKKRLTEWVREAIPKDRPGDFNQALMELGATVCLPNGHPKCEVCPVAFLCEARSQNRMTDFPVKSARPARKAEKKTILILLDGSFSKAPHRVLLRKRMEGGLLSGLWEFPNLNEHCSLQEIQQFVNASGLQLSSLIQLKESKNIFSHVEWDMIGYLGVVTSDTPPACLVSEEAMIYGALSDFQWIDFAHLDEKLALPAAFKTYSRSLKRYITEGTAE